jgi:RimJ/RimL family protein N-acetyltransferase
MWRRRADRTLNDTEKMENEEQTRRQPDLLQGANVVLRPRKPGDVAILHDGLYNDLATRAHADSRPWIPIPDDALTLSPFAVTTVSEDVSFFSVATLDEQLVGEALLWGIDTYNRVARVGLAFLPEHRGRGFSGEVLQLLCRYGFVIRGLNRLQLDTIVSNEPMIRSAKRAGFVEEGVLTREVGDWLLSRSTDHGSARGGVA